MDHPVLLSIIIPVFNTGAYLEECIESIQQANFKSPFEIILINDGSTDEATLDILKKYENEYKVIHQKNSGQAGARNTGIKHARGKYLLSFDSDDIMIKDNYNALLEIISKDKTLDVIYGDHINFGDRKGYSKAGEFDAIKILLGLGYIPSPSIYKKEVWEKTGGYDESLKTLEDTDFWVRVVLHEFKFRYCNVPLFYYRRVFNGSSVSQKNLHLAKDISQKIIQEIPRKVFTLENLNHFTITAYKNNKRLFVKLFIMIFFPKIFSFLKRKGIFKNDSVLY